MEKPVRPKLLTYKEAAKVLGISERSCTTLVKRGELRAVRIMHMVRIDPADIEAFIKNSTYDPMFGDAVPKV